MQAEKLCFIRILQFLTGASTITGLAVMAVKQLCVLHVIHTYNFVTSFILQYLKNKGHAKIMDIQMDNS